MLKLEGESFTTGRAQFRDQVPGFRELTAKVYVQVEFPGIENATLLAQLDTGAAYSTLGREWAEALGVLDGAGHPITLDTRLGKFMGRLERIPLTLIAEEGDSLDIEALFFVCREWPGKTFLGYTGLLEHLRFALDPSSNLFYFGSTG